ncbi:MAG: YHS domain-containing protein [Chloroflexi bacterium]|nr:YHS domain-containing protein [Chloroflexota bacterium]MBA3851208.1 YHS domain-containing protein [Chloroflexota bacterium]MDQ3406892.1 YHS domain-containing protein [Chloroflexota bacterium]
MAIAIDPVCGMEVQTETAQNTAEHEGTTYYFCSKGCRLEFGDEPDKYLDPEYQPTGM